VQKVDLARLANKLHMIASYLEYDACRLRAVGRGPDADALQIVSTQLDGISRGIGKRGESHPSA
jgi:hypothetical protein